MDLITLALSKKFTSDAIEAKADKTDIVQSDWNQNDETAIDYIKNRPFYEDEETEKIILQEATYTCMIDQTNIPYIQLMPCPLDLKEGNVYDVYVNGKLYTLKCNFGALQEGQMEQFYLGDRDFSNVPIFIRYISLISLFNISFKEPLEENTATICIKERIQNIKKIDRKFVNNIAGMDVKGNTFLIDDVKHTALNGAEIFNDYEKNIAVGQYSHAEGTFTAAVGDGSHAEGCITTASGIYSHAEGYNTKAIASSSHAEGASTKALGFESHAEGKGTIASGEVQHVQGQYNIEDTENKYAHIVGNGVYATRSNAHTLDWEGNAWYQGDIYVGSTSGTNKDEGSKKLATEEYVNTEVANLVNSAPETLDTLGELATALKENSDIVEVLNSAITNKADKSEIVQSDYNQNDETALDYIKNRPFYSTGEYEEIELLKDGIAYDLTALFGAYVVMECPTLENKHTYRFVFNGQEYIRTSAMNKNGYIGVGDISYINNGTWEDGKDPFYLEFYGGSCFIHLKDSTLNSTISIYETKEIIYSIDKKYIEKHLAGNKADQEYIYEDKFYTSQINAEYFNDASNIAIGENSHAEGKASVALGEYSHAEGYSSRAIGRSSHAGAGGEAIGDSSFAHNSSTASGIDSVAFGSLNEAYGRSSFVEGSHSIANGGYQHVQGKYNIPEERLYGRVIFTMNSNVSPTYDGEKIVYLLESTPTFDYFTGKYTITGVTTPTAYKDLQPNNVFLFEDTTETTIDSYYLVKSLIETKEDESGNTLYKWDFSQYSSKEYRDEGKYAHIVGNGTYDVKSNAYTLDWKGNGWYQGTVEATGLILSSPNGTRFKITVGDDGVLTSTEFTEEEKPFRPADIHKSLTTL